MDDMISREAAIDAINGLPKWIDTENGVCLRYVDVIAVFLPSAQPERKTFSSMTDIEFEKWLYVHGICHPDVCESIPCRIVPLLIDDAINELLSAQSEQKVGRWVDDGTELGFCCSECGSTFDDYFYGDLSDVSMRKVPKFCPNCGKKMEEQDG